MQSVVPILATLFGALALLLIAGVVYQIIGTRRDRNLFPGANGLSSVAIPGFGEVGPANQAVSHLLYDFDGVG